MNNGWVAKKELVDKVVGHLNEHPAGQKHVSELTEKEVRGKIWKHVSDTEENIELISHTIRRILDPRENCNRRTKSVGNSNPKRSV